MWPDAMHRTAAELLLPGVRPGPGDLDLSLTITWISQLQLNGKKCCLLWELSQTCQPLPSSLNMLRNNLSSCLFLTPPSSSMGLAFGVDIGESHS